MKKTLLALTLTTLLSACGGGGGDSTTEPSVPDPVVTPDPVNGSPTITTESNVTVDEGLQVTISAFVSDPENDDVTVNWDVIDGNVEFVQADNDIVFTAPDYAVDQYYTFRVTANDGTNVVGKDVNVHVVDADNELIEINNTSLYTVSGINNTENDSYKIQNFGFHTLHSTETYTEVVCYPTPDNCSDGKTSRYWWEQTSSATGDFNGDGHEDLVIAGAYFPHSTVIGVKQVPLIFLNDGMGNMIPGNDIIIDAEKASRSKMYHVEVKDFNRDGVDDILIGMMSMYANSDGEHEKPLLLLSDGNGRIYDASDDLIESRDPDEWHKFYAGHDLSAGDVNGDGYPDFYTGTYLGLSDGNGNFTKASLQNGPLQEFMWRSAMSSLLADFNNDGYADIIYNQFNGDDFDDGGSNIFVIMSDGTPNISNWSKTVIGKGVYGSNTKHNHAEYGDFNNDGNLDFVIGQTRAEPYYSGRSLDIYMGNGDGTFERTTDIAIDNTRRGGIEAHGNAVGEGEGQVHVRDINGDGYLDIFDSMLKTGFQAIYINNKNGTFTEVPPEELPHLKHSDIAGYEDDRISNNGMNLVNLDNKHGLDFVTSIRGPGEEQLEFEVVFYEIHSKQLHN